MRQHASLYLHDSPDGSVPSNPHRQHANPARRHRLLAAFMATATAGTLAAFSAAGASTLGPGERTALARPQLRHSTAPGRHAARTRELPAPSSPQVGTSPAGGHLASLLRRPLPSGPPRQGREEPAPRSWADAALHLSLARLSEPPPRHRSRPGERAMVHAELHRAVASSAEPSDGVSPETWFALRDCESGDDYAADTGNGYYGAYQFSLDTWWSIGYSGLPSDAPPPVQDAAAQRLLALQGWGAWPVCSVRIGL